MLQDLIHIEFDENQFEVSCLLTKEVMEAFENMPSDYMIQANRLIEGWYKTEKIKFYEFYDERLEAVWRILEKDPSKAPVKVSIAQGAPRITGLHITPDFHESNIVGELTIEGSPEKFSGLHLSWIVINLNKSLARHDANLMVDPAQIRAAVLQIMLNDAKIENIPISPKLQVNPKYNGKPYSIRTYDKSDEIELVLGSVQAISTEEGVDIILKELTERAQKRSEDPDYDGYYKILEKGLRREFIRANQDHRKLGLSMPCSMLAGIGLHPFDVENSAFGEGDKENEKFETAVYLNLMKRDDFEEDPKWVNDNLWTPISEANQRKIVSKLFRTKVIGRSAKTGKIGIHPNIIVAYTRRAKKNLDDPFYQVAIDRGVQSLTRLKAKRRSIQGLTMTIRKDHLPELLRKLSEFRTSVEKITKSCPQGNQLYQLNAQFVPLTRPATKISAIVDHSKGDEKERQKYPQWVNTTIRETLGLKDFHPDVHWIGARLYPAVSYQQISLSLESLKKSGLIVFNKEQNRYECPNPNIQTEAEVGGQNIIEFHKSMIEIATEVALKALPDIWEVSSMFFMTTNETAQKIKDLIYSFIEEIMNHDQEFGSGDEIYQLNLQLFPLTTSDEPKPSSN